MKILGQILLEKGYNVEYEYTGLLVDCSDEERKENGEKYLSHEDNLYNGLFCLVLHNEIWEDAYHPKYVDKINKELKYKYSKHIADNNPFIVKIYPIVYNKLKII